MLALRNAVRRLVLGTPLEQPIRFVWMQGLRVANPAYYERQQRNQALDRLLVVFLERTLKPASHCVDVGCYYGLVLKEICRVAPAGRHHAFEPIAELAQRLKARYPEVTVHNAALSSESGERTFHYHPKFPAQSGLRPMERYPDDAVAPEARQVRVARLDDELSGQSIDFIKIDTEGAELEVLRGALETLKRERPVVVFEHGKPAASYGDTSPGLWNLLVGELAYEIYELRNLESPLEDLRAFERAHASRAILFCALPRD